MTFVFQTVNRFMTRIFKVYTCYMSHVQSFAPKFMQSRGVASFHSILGPAYSSDIGTFQAFVPRDSAPPKVFKNEGHCGSSDLGSTFSSRSSHSLLSCELVLAFSPCCQSRARTPLAKRLRQFPKEWPLQLQSCPRGPDRSIAVGKLLDFLQLLRSICKPRGFCEVFFVSLV